MKLGYARVSTEDQNLDIQRGRLSQAGCEMMFEEKISGTARGRPELERLMAHLRKDDLLVVARLDRLARSTIDLLHIAERIKEKQAGLQSLDEPWADTTSPSGVMIMTVFAGIALIPFPSMVKDDCGDPVLLHFAGECTQWFSKISIIFFQPKRSIQGRERIADQ